MEITLELKNPMDNFLYALRAPETKRKYPRRLKFFFDFVFPKIFIIQEQAAEFIKNAKASDQFVYTSFFKFSPYTSLKYIQLCLSEGCLVKSYQEPPYFPKASYHFGV